MLLNIMDFGSAWIHSEIKISYEKMLQNDQAPWKVW